jgi:branched-chain amino acid transport system substrate-binding protein
MRTKNLPQILVAAALAGSLGCGRGPSGSATAPGTAGSGHGTGGEIVIGEYGSLTGDKATFGQMTHKGIELALEELNASGGLLGKKVRIIVEDDQGKPEEAANAVQKLVNQDRVVAVLGEVASSNSLAAAPICQAAKIPMVSPSSTNPKVTETGDYIFRACFIDPFQGTVMSKFARNTLKAKKVAILTDAKSDYSIGLAQFFKKDFLANGGQIVAEKAYSAGDSDFSAQLTAIRAASPEAIFVPGYYTEAALIAKQARGLNIPVPLLGGDGWDSSALFQIGGAALDNTYFSNHYSVDDPSPSIQKFVAAFKARHGDAPDGLAAVGYDAAKVLFDAIRRAGSTEGLKIRDALATTKDFAGVTGTISMDANRNPVKPAVVLRVEAGKLVYVETVAP